MFDLISLAFFTIGVVFGALFLSQKAATARAERESENSRSREAEFIAEYETARREERRAMADERANYRETNNRLITAEKRVAVLEAKPNGKAAGFLQEVFAENNAAKKKSPDPVGSFTALGEEVGELAKALMEESSAHVRAEAVQVASMAMRIALEGDPSLDAVREDRGADAHPLPEASAANG